MVNRPPPRQARFVAPQGKHHHLYGAKWRKCRELFLSQYPLCVACERAGKVVAATDVDHIKPHRGDEVVFWDSMNWQSLCRECHNAKTASGL
jgi:5-methylcytosine-specific restriction protein A